MLNGVPYTRYLDLAKVYYVTVKLNGGTGTILIHNSHLEVWGITQEQLIIIAEENTPRLLPAMIDTMCEVMKSLEGHDMLPQELVEDVMEECQLYIAISPSKTFGAAVLCYLMQSKDWQSDWKVIYSYFSVQPMNNL